jgi:D-glycero-D-manno-heptose 1,7-bisphosphate phosphatase
MKLIILDRDGVINVDSNDYIKSEGEWEAIPGSLEAIGRLCLNGFRVVVATNQAGLSMGIMTIEDLIRIHQKMYTQLAKFRGTIEAVFFCPHSPEEECECRKPKPGLLKEVSRRLRTPLENVILVGDKLSDVKAAAAVNCKSVLVRTGHGQQHVDAGEVPEDIPVYANLSEFVDELLTEQQ